MGPHFRNEGNHLNESLILEASILVSKEVRVLFLLGLMRF